MCSWPRDGAGPGSPGKLAQPQAGGKVVHSTTLSSSNTKASPLHPCSSHPEPSCQPHRGGAVSASGSRGGGSGGCCCCCLELCSGQHSHPDPCMHLAFPHLRIMSQQAVGVGGPEGQWECGYTGKGAAGHPPPAPSTSLSGRCKDLLENTSTGGNHESADFKEAPGRHLRCPEKPGLTVQTVLAIPSSTQTCGSAPSPQPEAPRFSKVSHPNKGTFYLQRAFPSVEILPLWRHRGDQELQTARGVNS